MIAYRRTDVRELNTIARTLLDGGGRLGRDRLRLATGAELAVGDRILCTRNNRRLDVCNGSRGTVVSVDATRRAVIVDLDDRRQVRLPAGYLDAGHVTHADALTGHKTQGLTVEQAFVLTDDRRALREWGYVASSRARTLTRLYTIETQVEPDASPHRIEPDGPVDRPAEALRRPATELLALDTMRGGSMLSDRSRLGLETRQLNERRAALERERLDAAQELRLAERTLTHQGTFGRALRGRALREQIGQRQRRLARVDSELVRVEKTRRLNRRRALAVASDELRPERALTRDREPALDRGRSLDAGIEL